MIFSALGYGITTLLLLWGLAGGDASLMWARLPLVSVITFVVALFFTKLIPLQMIPKVSLDLKDKKNWTLGLGIGFGVAIPAAVLAVLLKKNIIFSSLNESALFLQAPSIVSIILISFVLSSGLEIIYRGILAPQWGASSVAFLQAITIGFGTQKFLPFAGIFLMDWFSGFLTQKFNLSLNLVSRALWMSIVFLALYLS